MYCYFCILNTYGGQISGGNCPTISFDRQVQFFSGMIMNLQRYAIIIKQFLRRLDSLNNESRDEENILDNIYIYTYNANMFYYEDRVLYFFNYKHFLQSLLGF